MDQFQPLRDTIGYLAGTAVPRSTRPGEQFDMPEKHRKPIRIQPHHLLLIAGFLFGLLLAA